MRWLLKIFGKAPSRQAPAAFTLRKAGNRADFAADLDIHLQRVPQKFKTRPQVDAKPFVADLRDYLLDTDLAPLQRPRYIKEAA